MRLRVPGSRLGASLLSTGRECTPMDADKKGTKCSHESTGIEREFDRVNSSNRSRPESRLAGMSAGPTSDADEVVLIGENGAMPRKLSSPFQTWAARIPAVLFLVGVASEMVGMVLAPSWLPPVTLPPNIAVKIFLALCVAGILYGCIQAFRLKTVELDGNDLLISYFGKQIRVPLNAVAAVTGGLGGKNPIKVEFRIATDFGESITFVPPQLRSMWPWQRHPLVKELRDLAKLNT